MENEIRAFIVCLAKSALVLTAGKEQGWYYGLVKNQAIIASDMYELTRRMSIRRSVRRCPRW